MTETKTGIESSRDWFMRYLGHGLGQNSKMLEQAKSICEIMESGDYEPDKVIVLLSDLLDKCRKFTGTAVSIQSHATLWLYMMKLEVEEEVKVAGDNSGHPPQDST